MLYDRSRIFHTLFQRGINFMARQSDELIKNAPRRW